jgi:hypothetical protein
VVTACRKVDEAAEVLSRASPRLAQRLRLESISLRHLPILVLDALIDHPDAAELTDAAPWLAELPAHLDRVLELCDEALAEPQRSAAA